MKNKRQSNEYKSIVEEIFIDPLVELAVEERPKTALESEEHFKKRLKNKLTNSLKHYQGIVTEAINTLKHHGKWPNAQHFKQLAEKLSPDQSWQKENSENTVLQNYLGITDEELQSFYQVGSDLYQRGSFKEAGHIFLLLTQLNPKVAAFWMAFAIVEDKVGQIEIALYAYLWAAELDHSSFTAYPQAAKCCLLLQQPELAKKILHHALARCHENNASNNDTQKIEQMLQAIGK